MRPALQVVTDDYVTALRFNGKRFQPVKVPGGYAVADTEEEGRAVGVFSWDEAAAIAHAANEVQPRRKA